MNKCQSHHLISEGKEIFIALTLLLKLKPQFVVNYHLNLSLFVVIFVALESKVVCIFFSDSPV